MVMAIMLCKYTAFLSGDNSGNTASLAASRDIPNKFGDLNRQAIGYGKEAKAIGEPVMVTIRCMRVQK